VRVGWKYKSEDITHSIEDPAKILYLAKFQKSSINNVGIANQEFFRLYYRRFGRRHFIFPLILITIIVIIISSLVAEGVTSLEGHIWKPQISLNSTAIAALAGAYMWVVSDFISRSRRMDFSPADILWGGLRLVISVPLGLSLGAIVNKEVVDFVAFGLGAFPLTTIQVMLRQLSYTYLKVELGPTEKNDLLGLDGTDKPLVERLANEDITSIVQLAYCDPIQLTMRTNLSFNAVVDLVSQALAWVYVGDKLTVIRPLGVRGAYEVRQLLNDLASNDPPTKDAAEKIVPTIATNLGLENDRVWFVLRQISNDPYTDFIYLTWS